MVMEQTASYRRWGYAASVPDFLSDTPEKIIGALVSWSEFADELSQKSAWSHEIAILKQLLRGKSDGTLFFEFDIPRLGRRVDTIFILRNTLFVIEFKVGESTFTRAAIDQVWDYALDLKNFHEPSHAIPLIPILVATDSKTIPDRLDAFARADDVMVPVCCGVEGLSAVINFRFTEYQSRSVDADAWAKGRYHPTPTIVEAARALYAGHNVQEITRSDAGAQNLKITARRLAELIAKTRARREKAIFFVTGVPGAGKTLVGLDIANRYTNKEDELYSVYLSGNGPLVSVLCEALARDRVRRAHQSGRPDRIGKARSAVKQFIQNVHHFRDDCLAELTAPPIEHVALFDEAQRAWDLEQTANFMKRKKHLDGFKHSEAEFLISCMDRHSDWAAVVCLVGSGQEINTGEAGIAAWLKAISERFSSWHVYLSPTLREIEYHADKELDVLKQSQYAHWDNALHLAASMRSFRAERVSEFVNQLLALELDEARATLQAVLPKYPIRVTRDLPRAKDWLRQQARGTERYGVVVSSQAQRLKPHAIDVRVKVDPIQWFLEDKSDVRSSYYMEDVATEFQVQGLELDWTCVVWDGDLRLDNSQWGYFGFKGNRWERVRKLARQQYLLNAYRVLLTRARQGMVIVVPEGSEKDPTRASEYYDSAYELLSRTGVPSL